MGLADIDLKMMARCVELSATAVGHGELPFACVICRDGEIVAETTNRVVRDADADVRGSLARGTAWTPFVGREAELGRVAERLRDGQLGMDDVVLRRGDEGGMEVRMVKKLATGA